MPRKYTKATPEIQDKIKRLAAKGEASRIIADATGLSKSQVNRIIAGKVWKLPGNTFAVELRKAKNEPGTYWTGNTASVRIAARQRCEACKRIARCRESVMSGAAALCMPEGEG